VPYISLCAPVLTGVIGEGVASAIPVVQLGLGENYRCPALPLVIAPWGMGVLLSFDFGDHLPVVAAKRVRFLNFKSMTTI
jgi:hypothetical protein